MLEQLRIRNFKGWKDTGTIRMAPITLFFGANSSGKSSIGQFLLLLKQTMDSPDRKSVFFPGDKNSPVQLGSYREMVFGRDSTNRIVFQYRWSLPETLKVTDPLSDFVFDGDRLSFEAEVGLDEGQRSTLVVHNLKYELCSGKGVSLETGMERKQGARAEYQVEAAGYSLTRKSGRVWPHPAPVRFYGFPDEAVAYHKNADFVHTLNLRHEQLFRSLFYLGPLRTRAERLYSWTGIEPDSVGYAGEGTVAAILAARNRKISLGYKRRIKGFEEIVAIKLRDMGLIEDFRVTPISEQRQEYEVRVRTRGSRDSIDLSDVGSGILQVLPIVVQCFYAPPGSIVLMEHPELHLHPSAQSALADVIIDVVNSREHGADRKIQLIIETHSEHFLRRLQRRIAEDTLSASDVSAYFANVSRTFAMLDPLEVDLLGNVRNWPDHFFGDEMADIAGQAQAAQKRRMQHEPGSGT